MYCKIKIAGDPRPVQTYHVGIRLSTRRVEDESAFEQFPALHLVSHRRAS